MEAIKNWGLLLLFLSAGSVIYCFLLPSGAVSRLSKSVISIVVIFSLFMPLFSVFKGISGTELDLSVSSGEENLIYYFEAEGKRAVEEIIRRTVRKFTTVPYTTEIFINIENETDINIEYVGITFSALPQFQKEIEDELLKNLGIIPHIRVELLSE